MARSNKKVVPEAAKALDSMKMEIANQMGVNFSAGDNGNLTSRQAGSVGGEMTKRLIQQAEQNMSK